MVLVAAVVLVGAAVAFDRWTHPVLWRATDGGRDYYFGTKAACVHRRSMVYGGNLLIDNGCVPVPLDQVFFPPTPKRTARP